MEPELSVCGPRNRIRFRESSGFSFAVVWFIFCVLPSFFLVGAIATALKSEAAVDGNRKDVADHVAKPAGLPR